MDWNLSRITQRIHTIGFIEIMKSNFGNKNMQRSVQFVMSKSSVIMAGMELKLNSLVHLETTPLCGWSHPEDHIATWMSYDTEIQKILLKKLITNACTTRIKSTRLLYGKCQTITFRFLNGNGKTSWPMNSVTDTWEISDFWYDMKIIKTEKQMEQFIDN